MRFYRGEHRLLVSAGAGNDRSFLLRDLVDHVILFAWLAAAPEDRVQMWETQDMRKRLVMDDAVQQFGAPVLDPAWRAELESRVAKADVKGMPTSEQMATQADEYWQTRIRFFAEAAADGKVFEMIYAGVFRYLSGFITRLRSLSTASSKRRRSTASSFWNLRQGRSEPCR